ncbi:MAG: cytochrome C, partial [Rhodocyclales bacterium]|nr:cytochrome C [Rhodocyclales bacterium]
MTSTRQGGALRALGGGLLLATLGLLASAPALAVPSFARQTGQECAACHIGAYGPQLTPYGVRFKIGGYTDTDGKEGKVPLSAMLVTSFTRTAKAQDEKPDGASRTNNNRTMDETSVFLAGRLADQIGAFIQTTYSGIDKKGSMDQADIRFAHVTEVAGKETVLGLSLNNNPGGQDPFNSMPAWGFPYVGSDLAFGSGSISSMINGGLTARVTGLSAYAFWNNAVYAEVGTYRSLSPSMQSKFGLGRADDMGRLGAGTSYWRLAYMQDMKKQAFNAGIFGFNTNIQPDRSTPGSNRYNDLGVDASYQFLGTREHVATVSTSYIRERQTLNAALDAGDVENRKARLNEFKANASYHYNQTWGLTGSRFITQGSKDAVLYSDGYANSSPNTSGYILQADWTPWGKEASWGAPWANLRLGVQYTMYTKYNGAKTNYDGNGRDAKD